jgi:hypothetical protein
MRVVTARPTTWSKSWRVWLTEPDQFGLALVLILATIIASAIEAGPLGQLAAASLGGATLLFVLVTSRARPRTVRVAVAVIVIAIAAASLAVVLGFQDRNPYSLVLVMLALVAPPSLVRRLLAADTITLQTVAGALCLYLLIGLLFASVYSVMDGFWPPFFATTDAPVPSDFLYFSYITITTVGYGDFTAASSIGHMLAATEALIGQIYLVAGVALLVSNLGRRRPRRVEAPPDLVDELRAMAPDDHQ